MSNLKSAYVNLYNDQNEDLFVNDLSNMEIVFAEFAKRIESGALRYERVNKDSDIKMLLFVNELDRYIDAISFFQIEDAFSLVALAVFTLSHIDGENNKFKYSVGYCVKEEYRGRGTAGKLIAASTVELRSILDRLGPNYDIGPSDSFVYILETVVAQHNQPSNNLAKKLLHSGDHVETGNELRTQESSNIYQMRV